MILRILWTKICKQRGSSKENGKRILLNRIKNIQLKFHGDERWFKEFDTNILKARKTEWNKLPNEFLFTNSLPNAKPKEGCKWMTTGTWRDRNETNIT